MFPVCLISPINTITCLVFIQQIINNDNEQGRYLGAPFSCSTMMYLIFERTDGEEEEMVHRVQLLEDTILKI